MKFTYWFLAVIITSYSMSYIERMGDKKKRMDLVESSYNHGCLTEALRACPRIKNEIERGDCYEDASENCPKNGYKFRKALEDYKP